MSYFTNGGPERYYKSITFLHLHIKQQHTPERVTKMLATFVTLSSTTPTKTPQILLNLHFFRISHCVNDDLLSSSYSKIEQDMSRTRSHYSQVCYFEFTAGAMASTTTVVQLYVIEHSAWL